MYYLSYYGLGLLYKIYIYDNIIKCITSLKKHFKSLHEYVVTIIIIGTLQIKYGV